MAAFKALTEKQVQTLEAQGCTAEDWSKVQAKEGFDPGRVREVAFAGKVRIGELKGSVSLAGNVKLPSELREATIIDCEIGDGVRIANVGGHLSSYHIGNGAAIIDVGVMATNKGATFGNGVELEAANEGGGREIRIHNELSSQFAYLVAMHRYRPKMIEQLDKMVDHYVAKVKSDVGTVGEGAVIEHCNTVIDVNVGPHACVSGAARLENGTILSEKGASTFVGASVMAEDFIFAEGANVDTGAVLTKVFIGQAAKVGRQFSAENSLLFANCEGFHSEAVAIFAGPYTVTHHRSTLLIAGVYSFFNAGSGTNQSNHMYKLGPVHQGIMERGSKTGSFSYMLWPCVVSPFSVVIGKNMANFDISEFPFSYVTAESDGSYLTPAMNMFTVGTTRDGEKWPKRDKRKASDKRDRIRFDVFSPYVVGRMLKGEKVLRDLHQNTEKSQDVVRYKGITIKRLLLRGGAKNYAQGIDRYLNEKIVERAAGAIDKGIEAVRKAFAPDPKAVYSEEWSDISGLLIARDRLKGLEAKIEKGGVTSVEDFNVAMKEAWEAYKEDEWVWVRKVYEERHGKSVDDLMIEDIEKARETAQKAKASFAKKILLDAQKEFDEVSSLGFGADGDEEERRADFEQVRGTYEGNSFVKKMQEEMEEDQPAKA